MLHRILLPKVEQGGMAQLFHEVEMPLLTILAEMELVGVQLDLPLLADLSQVMRDASICGLGQAAPNPVDCVVRYFPHELKQGEGA